MAVHNLMEEIVKSYLKELAAHNQSLVGLDESSLDDIIAITLNNLPPKYVASSKGEMLVKTQLRAQTGTDVFRELTHAIDKVVNHNRRSELRE